MGDDGRQFLERAARIFCRAMGIDEDAQVPFHDETQFGGVGMRAAWISVADSIKRHQAIEMAIASAGPPGDPVVASPAGRIFFCIDYMSEHEIKEAVETLLHAARAMLANDKSLWDQKTRIIADATLRANYRP